VFRIEPDRLVVVGDGTVVVALGAPSYPPIDEGDYVLRIEPYRLVIVGRFI